MNIPSSGSLEKPLSDFPPSSIARSLHSNEISRSRDSAATANNSRRVSIERNVINRLMATIMRVFEFAWNSNQ